MKGLGTLHVGISVLTMSILAASRPVEVWEHRTVVTTQIR